MRFTFFALVLALLTFSAAAQDKKNSPAHSSTSVLINGQPIKGKVLELDGKHFVAVEDMAQSLHGTIAYGEGRIALSLSELPPVTVQPPPSELPSLSAQPTESGRIQGTLTYFFDFHVGNKPDAGSKVWLVRGRVEIPPNQTFVATSTWLGTDGNPERYSVVQHSVAEESGNFELLNIVPGDYTLIMQSAHTVGTLKEKRNLFGRANGRTARDAKGRVEFLNVLVKPGETVDGSRDFGPNIDM